MKNTVSIHDRAIGALYGMFIGDALAMPVHWYYDTKALRRDYGEVVDFLQPLKSHPDSILWRSSYHPVKKSVDILHEQRQFWGVKDIHYHQFLQAGENTLNVKLARELLSLIREDGAYSTALWLDRMVSFLTTPGNHRDTYVEEYLRHFFTNYGQGKAADQCGRNDEQHIGGYSLMLPLIIAYADRPEYAKKIALEHLALTHGGPTMHRWGAFIASTLLHVFAGSSLQQALLAAVDDSNVEVDVQDLQAWEEYPDEMVVGKHFSSACYVDQAVPATMYLTLKYSASPQEGLVANTMCGGDNAGRAAVMGALLGALHGVGAWPARWLDGLLQQPPKVLPSCNNML